MYQLGGFMIGRIKKVIKSIGARKEEKTYHSMVVYDGEEYITISLTSDMLDKAKKREEQIDVPLIQRLIHKILMWF